MSSESYLAHRNTDEQLDYETSGQDNKCSISTITDDTREKQHYRTHAHKSPGWGARHTLCVLLLLGSCASFLNRVNLSITIVAMVSSDTSAMNNSESDVCPVTDNTTSSKNNSGAGEFDWDEKTQGLLLGSFYYGYLVSNFLGGIATEYVGGRLMMLIAVLSSSILGLLSPLCAYSSLPLFVAVRVLSGLFQGPLLAATTSLLATWIPPQERAKLCSITFTGIHFGTVLTMATGGVLSESNILGGWPSVFYIFGIAGIVWSVPWMLMVRDRPENHSSISEAELSYLRANKSTIKNVKRVKIPWTKIATSAPFWSLIVLAWGDNFGFFTLLTEIPTYLKNIQHMSLTNNGLLSALPYIMAIICGLTWGRISDYLTSTNKLSVNESRKLSTAIASYGPALGLITICFVDCNSTLAVVCLCFSVGVNAFSSSGGAVSEQDIAPNLAGMLKGVTNGVGSLTGIVAPFVTGAITSDNQTLSAWRTVFGISAVTYFVCGTVFVIFGTDQVQPWNEPKEKNEPNKY